MGGVRVGTREVLVFLLAILVLPISSVQSKADDKINPLRFGEDRKAWQLTLNISRYVDEFTVRTRDSAGLWEEEKKITGTTYGLQSSFDLNEKIGFRGGFSYYSDSISSKATNLWTGGRTTNEETSSGFGGASLKIKLNIWENSEVKTHFLVPVLGGSAGVGLVWSRDPVMVFPKFSLTGDGFDLNTGISFVANSKIAINGKLSFSQKGDDSTVGFGGGLVYRNGEYDGINVSGSLRRGDSTQVSLGIGLSYGQEKE